MCVWPVTAAPRSPPGDGPVAQAFARLAERLIAGGRYGLRACRPGRDPLAGPVTASDRESRLGQRLGMGNGSGKTWKALTRRITGA